MDVGKGDNCLLKWLRLHRLILELVSRQEYNRGLKAKRLSMTASAEII